MEHILIAGTHTAAVSIAGLSNGERPELAFDLTIPLKAPAHHLLNLTAACRREIPEGPHSAAQPGAGDGGTQAEMKFLLTRWSVV
jgi:hypothetical protein